MSMLVIALAAALVSGATMAWFTDTATSLNNTFSAGTVDIVLNYDADDAVIPIADFANIAPGWQSAIVNVDLRNAGSLPVKVKADVTLKASNATGAALYAALEGRVSIDGGVTWFGESATRPGGW